MFTNVYITKLLLIGFPISKKCMRKRREKQYFYNFDHFRLRWLWNILILKYSNLSKNIFPSFITLYI